MRGVTADATVSASSSSVGMMPAFSHAKAPRGDRSGAGRYWGGSAPLGRRAERLGGRGRRSAGDELVPDLAALVPQGIAGQGLFAGGGFLEAVALARRESVLLEEFVAQLVADLGAQLLEHALPEFSHLGADGLLEGLLLRLGLGRRLGGLRRLLGGLLADGGEDRSHRLLEGAGEDGAEGGDVGVGEGPGGGRRGLVGFGGGLAHGGLLLCCGG